jgi:hypothetical protein
VKHHLKELAGLMLFSALCIATLATMLGYIQLPTVHTPTQAQRESQRLEANPASSSLEQPGEITIYLEAPLETEESNDVK